MGLEEEEGSVLLDLFSSFINYKMESSLRMLGSD